MTKTSWLKDKYVKTWFDKLGNTRSVRNYTREFPLFLEFAKETPSQMIENRLSQLATQNPIERRYYEDILIKYKHHLESKNLRMATIHGYLRTVQSFFANNNVRLNFARKELHIEPSEKDKVETEWIPSNEEIRLLYRMCQTARDRAILLALYQSGFSEVDLASMKIEQFKFYDSNGSWQIGIGEDVYHARRREKTNQWQQTCISKEALDEIRIMLQQRGFPKEGYLFVSFRGKKLDVREINEMIKGLVKKAFNGRDSEWKTKHLRDAYMNGLLKAKIPQEVKDAMVGHKREGARHDYALTEDTIKTAYSDAFKFLTINGLGSTNRKIEELETKMTEDKQALTELITEQQKLLTQTRDELAQVYGRLNERDKELAKLGYRFDDTTKELAEIRKLIRGLIPKTKEA